MTEAQQSPGVLHSRLLWIAAAVTLAGAGLWAYAAATAGGGPGPGVNHTMVTGLDSGGSGPRPAAQPRMVDQASPALFRFGGSFVVGFLLGWVLRRFVKLAILAG